MELIDLTSNGDDNQLLADYLNKLCNELEFEFSTYACLNSVEDNIQGASTYPTAWQQHYAEQNMHTFDPALYEAARSVVPVDWERLKRDERFQTVFRHASDFGITSRGVTVPIRGPYGDFGILSVTRSANDHEWDLLKKRSMPNLQMAAVQIHDAVLRTGVLNSAMSRPLLSSREIEILQWSAMGKSQQDIGDILKISHRTVEVHLRSARTKLGALNTPQAVGRGIAVGIIEPG